MPPSKGGRKQTCQFPRCKHPRGIHRNASHLGECMVPECPCTCFNAVWDIVYVETPDPDPEKTR